MCCSSDWHLAASQSLCAPNPSASGRVEGKVGRKAARRTEGSKEELCWMTK